MPKTIKPPTLKRFPAAKQRRLDLLLEKSSEGTISPRERMLLKSLVLEAEHLMVSNAKRLSEFAKSGENAIPTQSVPVTVWVSPTAPVK